jgi:DNA-binding Xre family transcriptional regulator
MTNLNLNEQGVMSETFTTQQLAQTMAIIEHALSTLYDGKASAIDTLNALNLKADITYVDNLV